MTASDWIGISAIAVSVGSGLAGLLLHLANRNTVLEIRTSVLESEKRVITQVRAEFLPRAEFAAELKRLEKCQGQQ